MYCEFSPNHAIVLFEAMKNKPTPIFKVDNFQLNSESEKLNKLISDTISVARMNKNVK